MQALDGDALDEFFIQLDSKLFVFGIDPEDDVANFELLLDVVLMLPDLNPKAVVDAPFVSLRPLIRAPVFEAVSLGVQG